MTSAYWELSNYIERADLSSWTSHCDFCCLFGLSPCMINRHFKYNIPLLCVVLCSAAQLLPTPCKPMDCSPWGFFVHGIFQARILEWVAISYARGSSRPRDQTHISCISCKPISHASPALAGSLLTTVPPVKHIFFWGGHIFCVTEVFSQYHLFLMKFSSTWFMETPFPPFLLPQICQTISSLPIPYTVHPFITSARLYPTLPLLSLDPRQVTPHFDYFGNISSSLSVSILPLTLACFQSSNPYDSFEIHIKSSCNQAGPYQAFPRKTSLPHILSYSSLEKYPDNSIWCRFHELLYICKKPPPNEINYLMTMST